MAELLAPLAVARLPTAVANAPVAVAPTHWVWPAVAVAQSCAIAIEGAMPMANNKDAVRFVRTSVFDRLWRLLVFKKLSPGNDGAERRCVRSASPRHCIRVGRLPPPRDGGCATHAQAAQ